MKAKLSHSTLEVNDCVLRAPFDGEVATRTMDPGAFVRPGMAIVSVVDRSTVRLVADVPESDFALVPPGTPVRIDVRGDQARASPPSSPGARRPRIPRRAPSTSRSTWPIPTRNIPVGTTGEIHLDVGQPEPATELPLVAASVRDGKASIFVVEGDVAHARTVAVKGESGGDLFLDTVARARHPGRHRGARAADDGDHVSAQPDDAPQASAAPATASAPASAVAKEHHP